MILISVLVTCMAFMPTFAQDATEHIPAKDWTNGTSISAGLGGLTYFGDIGMGTKNDLSNLAGYRWSLFLNGTKKIKDDWGISTNIIVGGIGKNERTTSRNLNFRSGIISLDAQALYYIDNDKVLKKTDRFIPMAGIGLGIVMYKPKGDLLDANGQKYHYWTDGTIRDQQEQDIYFPVGNTIGRDHVYETDLDTTDLYGGLTLTIPITIGIKLKLSEHTDFLLSTTYYHTFSDYLDGFSHENKFLFKKDKMMLLAASISYRFDAAEMPAFIGEDELNLLAIDWMDEDNDGVHDFKDKCPGSVPGLHVDEHGCTLDKDGDGIPDHMDKEPNTLKGAQVDQHGITIKNTDIAQIHTAYQEMRVHVDQENDQKQQAAVHPSQIRFKVEIISTIQTIGEDEKVMFPSIPGIKMSRSGDSLIFTAGDYAEIEEAEERRLALIELGFIETKVNMYVRDKIKKSVIGQKNHAMLPPLIKQADKDEDGVISKEEVQNQIDAFLEGTTTLKTEQVQKIIEYFLDQE